MAGPIHARQIGAHQLTSQEWETFLGCLAPERNRAAGVYEGLRTRLTLFFERRGCLAAEVESLADETFNRVARKTLEGEPIRDIHSYALAVARFVAMEHQRERRPVLVLPDEGTLPARLPEEPESHPEARAACFDRCLARLTEKQMRVIRRYFTKKKGDPPIPNSVRVRKNEIVRKILRPCCRACFERELSSAAGTQP